MKKLLIAIALLLLPCSSHAVETTVTGPEHTTELWEGKALTATFRIGMCYDAKGKANGVLILRHRNGQEDVYHLYGTLKNNEFDLSHGSGHHMTGRLTGENSMEGKARLKSGIKLSLSGKRFRHVPLVKSDCAPLPR